MQRCLLARHIGAVLGATSAVSFLHDRASRRANMTCYLSCETNRSPFSASSLRAGHVVASSSTSSRWIEEAADFARQGALYSKLPAPPFEAEWLQLGSVLADKILGSPEARPSALDQQVAKRIYHIYLPIYFWMRHKMHELRSLRPARSEKSDVVVFGLSAPQGCGKTTTVELLKELFVHEGIRFQALSIDDFYLPRSWQEVVAELNQDNALLQSRGNAGTHDVGLGERTLKALSNSAKTEVPLPRYDKSAEAGKGDRVQSSLWPSQNTPIDVLVLEGWMLGFKPRTDLDALSKIHPSLTAVNEKLSKYEVWDEQIDAWCVIGTENLQQVFKWRLEAEHKMKASGRSGMTDEEVRRFVEIYMPAYAAYSERLFDAAADQGVDGKPSLCFYVGPDRNPLPDL